MEEDVELNFKFGNLQMNQQEIISELEKRCGVFRKSYKSREQSVLLERDALISFAKAAVMRRVLTRS